MSRQRRPGESRRLVLGTCGALLVLISVVYAPWERMSTWWLVPWCIGALLTGCLLLWDDWHR